MSTSLMVELARQIALNATKIDEYYFEHNLPLPSFEHDAQIESPELPCEIDELRQAVIHDCQDLKILMQGPAERFHGYAASRHGRLRWRRLCGSEALKY
jgi:hypothetical protein